MLDARAEPACCDRCADGGTAARVARRRLLKAAVFRSADPAAVSPAAAVARPGAGGRSGTGGQAGTGFPAAFATPGELPRAVTGTIIDVSPHFLVVSHGDGQQRLALTPDAGRLARPAG